MDAYRMKLHLMSPDAHGRIDGTLNANLYGHLPLASYEDCDAVVVPVSYYGDYAFNTRLGDIRKPVIVVDFMEYYGAWDEVDTHLFGKTGGRATALPLPAGYEVFDAWVEAVKPALYFKRELLAKDRSDTVIPIEFPCYLGGWEMENEANFNARKVEVFNCWGFSNPLRPKLHGEIFENMCGFGLNLIGAFDHFDHRMSENIPRLWATIFQPHFTRMPMSQVLLRQSQSKLAVSLPGAGIKCFRSGEAPVNSIMALPEDNLAWSFPWVHGENCIRLDPENLFWSLDDATKRDDLHKIYLASQQTVDRYRTRRYLDEYLLPEIAKRL